MLRVYGRPFNHCLVKHVKNKISIFFIAALSISATWASIIALPKMIKLDHTGDEKSKRILVFWYIIMKHAMKVTKISSDWRWLLWMSQNLKTRSQLWQRRNAGKYDLPSDKPTFVWCIICQVLAHVGWVSSSHRANYHQLRDVLIALGMQMQYYDALCRVTTLLSARRKPRLATSQIDHFQTEDIHGTSRSYTSTAWGGFPETTISAGKNPS